MRKRKREVKEIVYQKIVNVYKEPEQETREQEPIKDHSPYHAPKCPFCLDKMPGTYVYATRQSIRYCKCRRCGYTFKN